MNFLPICKIEKEAYKYLTTKAPEKICVYLRFDLRKSARNKNHIFCFKLNETPGIF